MTSPITSTRPHTPRSPQVGSGSAALSPQSGTTDKVADYFRRNITELHENFTSTTDASYRNHFQKSKTEILKAAEGLSGTALLLGVGGAHDLPLTELANQFDTIHLVDIDTTLIDSEVAKLPEDIRHKFHIHAIDLTGILTRLDTVLDVVVASGSPHKEFCDRAVEALQRIRKAPLPLPEHSASFVVSSLLSSQLSHQLNEYLNKRSQDAYGESFIRDPIEMLQLADTFAAIEESHMEDLLNLVTREGRVYFSDNFSFQNVQTLHCEDKSPKIFHGEDTPLYCGVRVQEFAQKHFNILGQQQWDWALAPHKREEFTVKTEFKSSAKVYRYTHINYHITALTLSPK